MTKNGRLPTNVSGPNAVKQTVWMMAHKDEIEAMPLDEIVKKCNAESGAIGGPDRIAGMLDELGYAYKATRAGDSRLNEKRRMVIVTAILQIADTLREVSEIDPLQPLVRAELNKIVDL